ncbi:unnamed protein product [Blepharisma stoltei]|uniref:Uncharacterized protein n=1 Tax=Blepharisma stoltei TaxID=1481888 RepID=A0AAU9J623_9CILI|nr:unnamed protein product [Blepharisma stoltei]
MITTRLQKIITACEVLLNATSAVKTSTTAASAGGVLSKIITAGKYSKGFAYAGAAISAIDIVLTWTLDNETLEEFKSQIKNKKMLLNEESRELRDLKIISPR